MYADTKPLPVAGQGPTATPASVEGRYTVASEYNQTPSLTRMTLEVTRSAGGGLNVSVDQARARTLSVRDIMAIQQAVEDKFFELLASLPDDVCSHAKRVKR